MKAISVLQPWASLIVHGRKRFETRSWQTRHRGPLLIAASARFPAEFQLLCGRQPFLRAFQKLYLAGPRYDAGALDIAAQLPLGAIIGRVTLAACWPVNDMPAASDTEK